MFVLSAHDRCFVGFQFGLDPVEPFDDLVNAAIQAGCQIVDPVIQASSEIVDTLINSLEMFVLGPVGEPKRDYDRQRDLEERFFPLFHTRESITRNSRPDLNWL